MAGGTQPTGCPLDDPICAPFTSPLLHFEHMNAILKSTLLMVAVSLVLSGCKPPQDAQNDPNANLPQVTAQTEPTVADALDNEIPAESLSVKVELLGQPTYVAANDTMRIKLRIQNNSKDVFLTSNGSKPMNAGVMLLGPEGPDKAPGKRDFVRIPLPTILAGASEEVSGELPAKELLGLPVRVVLVQEGVRWFDDIGLDVGTFKRCDGNEASLCDANKTALAAE